MLGRLSNKKNAIPLLFVVIICIYFNHNYMSVNDYSDNVAYIIPKKASGLKASALNVSQEDMEKVQKFHRDLLLREKKIFSQNKEDGVIEALIEFIKFTGPGYYVEFGSENGKIGNTRNLRENHNWTGLLMDGSNQNAEINQHKEMITHQNILGLFRKHKVPIHLDIFSEDTDYADYWIVEQVMTKYKPKIVIMEVNQQDTCVTVQKPEKLTFWGGSNYHGASACAFRCLAMQFGYTQVYCESKGVNCFWVMDKLIEQNLGVASKTVQMVLTPTYLFKKTWEYHNKSSSQIWVDIVC